MILNEANYRDALNRIDELMIKQKLSKQEIDELDRLMHEVMIFESENGY